MTMLGILVVLLLITYILMSQRGLGPIDSTNIKSHHLKTDSISDLLDRVEWSLMRDNRVDYVVRYLMWGLWVTFLGSFLILGYLPRVGLFLRNWLVISVILLSLHGYYYWHSDKFSSYAALSTLETLRDRIGVEKGDIETHDTIRESPAGSDAPWTFTHDDYAIGTRFPHSE